jgi:hypothetical protein
MSDLEQLEGKLAELRAERDGLLGTRTKEDTRAAATAFLEDARARSEGLGGLIIGGHATGQPLADVLHAFLLSDPRLEAWLIEQAEQFAELTAKQRDSRLRKITAEVKEAEDALREARKKAAIEKIERVFAGDARVTGNRTRITAWASKPNRALRSPRT